MEGTRPHPQRHLDPPGLYERPENLQGALAAGLLAVGSSFVGTMENCSGLLDRIAAAADPEVEVPLIAQHYKQLKSPIPGFSHHLHKPVDRTPTSCWTWPAQSPNWPATSYAHSSDSQRLSTP